MRHAIVLLVAMALTQSCRREAAPPARRDTPQFAAARRLALASPQPDAPVVSMVALIARPENFDGKAVRVAGYANLEFEGSALYLHREDFEQLLLMHSVRLDLPLEPAFTTLNGGYVGAAGIFRARKAGARRVHCGWLEDVSEYEEIPSRAEFLARPGAEQ